MHFQPIDEIHLAPHRFLALGPAPSAQDALIRALALSLRRAYGEDHLRAVASAVNVAATADPAVAARFDLDALARAASASWCSGAPRLHQLAEATTRQARAA